MDENSKRGIRRRMFTEWFTLFIATQYLCYVLVGCGSTNEATKHLDVYDDLPFADTMTLNASRDEVYKAVIRTVHQRGLVVTLSDPVTGLINTEINSGSVIPEEQKEIATAESEGTSVGEVVLIVISIILIFGIIIMLTESPDENTKEEPSGTSSSVAVNVDGQAPTTSYKYVISITAAEKSDSTTELQLSVVRMVISNGSVVQSAKFENKYLNHSIFDGVESELSPRKE